jgi:hypothetical protein
MRSTVWATVRSRGDSITAPAAGGNKPSCLARASSPNWESPTPSSRAWTRRAARSFENSSRATWWMALIRFHRFGQRSAGLAGPKIVVAQLHGDRAGAWRPSSRRSCATFTTRRKQLGFQLGVRRRCPLGRSPPDSPTSPHPVPHLAAALTPQAAGRATHPSAGLSNSPAWPHRYAPPRQRCGDCSDPIVPGASARSRESPPDRAS